MSTTFEHPDTAVAPEREARGAAALTLARVNPLEHREEIKQLFLDDGRQEFPDYFERAYPDAVANGATSWVGRDEAGRLCAHIAQFPREFVFGRRIVRGALLANLMVATAHRSFWPALALARRGKVPPPGPIHVAAEVDEARALYNLVKTQGRDGALGIVQGEHALGRIEFSEQAGVKTSDPEVQPGVEPPHAEG